MTSGDAVSAGLDATVGSVPQTGRRAALGRRRPRTDHYRNSACSRLGPLGIVPAGTVNDRARLGLPFEVERACAVIAGGKTLSLDLVEQTDAGSSS